MNLVSTRTARAPSRLLDWGAEVEAVIQNLSRLIQIDTTNPPGDELPAILLVREMLLSQGFPEDDLVIVESAPRRANLVARLRGDGSQRPLLLSGHVDVVPVEREHWSRDPFGGEIAEGCVWGRGSFDMKGFLAMYLQVFLLAFRQGLPLKRDLILAAIADEEAGFIHGSRFLVDRHRELIDAEWAFTEGGALTLHLGKARIYPIQVAEKGIAWLKLTTCGRPGHGSLPHSDNAVLHLAQALDRVRRAGNLPVHVTPPFRSLVTELAKQLSSPARQLVPLLANPTIAGLLLKVLPPDQRTLITALLSNTVTPTVLRAGGKTNVIPASCEAHLDCRLLPGQTPADVMREIIALTGDGIALEVLSASTGTSFPADTPLYRLLEAATRSMDPKGLVIPLLMPGATDACEYQRAGITVYGFTPGVLPDGFPLLKMGHGHDERLPISYIETGLPTLWKVITEFCT